MVTHNLLDTLLVTVMNWFINRQRKLGMGVTTSWMSDRLTVGVSRGVTSPVTGTIGFFIQSKEMLSSTFSVALLPEAVLPVTRETAGHAP